MEKYFPHNRKSNIAAFCKNVFKAFDEYWTINFYEDFKTLGLHQNNLIDS